MPGLPKERGRIPLDLQKVHRVTISDSPYRPPHGREPSGVTHVSEHLLPMSLCYTTPLPTATLVPTATATPTLTPTVTPTPIPTLPPDQLGGLTGVPDPQC